MMWPNKKRCTAPLGRPPSQKLRRVAWRVLVVVALLVWLPPRAYAPIFSVYPGLRSLIDKSEIIAAATIVERLSAPDFGGLARYKIEFTKVLKGAPSQKQAIAWLRRLEIIPVVETPTATNYFAPNERHDFRPGYRYMLFLVKSERGDGIPYQNVNCEGSSFPISPLRDVGSLKVESLPDTLVLLFREYVNFKRNELKNLEQQLNAFTHEGEK